MIKLGNNKIGQVKQPVRYKDIMVGIANILVVEDDNHLLYKNNVEYVWARFIEVSKMTKKSITIFFINFNLAPIWEH